MSDENIVDLMTRKPTVVPASVPDPIEYEVHFYPVANDTKGEVVNTKGFLKFGPQFIAVLEGPNDTDAVVFTVATGAVQFIRRVDADGSVQATLSL